MSFHHKIRGGSPVGYLDELPPVEMAAIVYYRMICANETTREQLSRDFALAFGIEYGAYCTRLLLDFAQVLSAKSRRQIMRHAPNCSCFGGDENVIANMIAAAAIGDRKEAELLASTLVPCDIANKLVEPAEHIGLALNMMMERFPMPVLACPDTPQTRH